MSAGLNEGSVVGAALDYVGRGWPVIPIWWVDTETPHSDQEKYAWACACPKGPECESPGKHPLTRNGLKDATLDPDKVYAWWTKRPQANVGICTGHGVDVLDVDSDDWQAGLVEFEGLYDSILDDLVAGRVLSVMTGKKGLHLLFGSTGIGNRAHFAGRCDWRGKGGYVVAPPSMHASGSRYAWINTDDVPAPSAPDVVAELLKNPKRPGTAPSLGEFDPDLVPQVDEDDMPTRWANHWSADGLIKRISQAVEGERNEVISWAGHRLWEDRKAGRIPSEQAFDEAYLAMYQAATGRGLSDDEVRLCLRPR